MTLFHLAFPVDDLERARSFYAGILDAEPGRACGQWMDFDLFGHQLSAHRVAGMPEPAGWSDVDGVAVPIPHFGVVLRAEEWERLVTRITDAGETFLVEPGVRFDGQAGEQRTFFVRDPAGNALEFKTFTDPAEVFV